ncbi:MAG: hypothetical protein E7240_06570 [Lachnospiraceae bacterium]|nr:hypothetical protein [Lachnospiraceae bacterium]
MTKQELIKMTGTEERATYAMEIILKNCKEAFVRMAIQTELNEIDNQIKALEAEEILVKNNGTYTVNWAEADKPFGNEPGAFWRATEEQKQEAERIEERCRDAEALLYRRNRTIDLIAIK